MKNLKIKFFSEATLFSFYQNAEIKFFWEYNYFLKIIQIYEN